jgi:branched-chain amino acid transport system ATP-binding protein
MAALANGGPGEVSGGLAREREPVLELVGLSSGYGDLPAVRDVSLRICPGEVVALFGPNGAGKTTTLLAAVGVLPRMRGSVFWRGSQTREPLHKLVRGGLAFVPEERSIIAGLSAKDNLRLGRGGVDAAIAHFPELEPHLSRKAGLLSGGQQQMLTLARALASEPVALLVDELSLGLAPLIVERLLEGVRRAAKDRGVAVLLVEQQARRALSVADRWYLLSNGEVVTEGDADSGVDVLEAAYVSQLPGPMAEPDPLDA